MTTRPNRTSKAPKTDIKAELGHIASIVETRLVDFFREIESRSPSHFFTPYKDTPLIPHIRDLTLRGGKRLRAGLLIAGAELFEPQAVEQTAVIDAAAALELRQSYLLIHDDIMDGDTTRRGGPSVHVALAGFTGDARLGENLGILAGDLACALEQVLLQQMDIDADRLTRVLEIFAAMHMAVVQGQTLDLLGQVSAFEVALHKTASYTTVGPLSAGAALAGARDRDIKHLAAIAEPLGVAFQFRDDLLGTFGDPAKTGKPADSDLLEGKRTVLVEETLARGDRLQKQKLTSVLGNPEASLADLADARDIMVQCGAKAACEQHISELTGEFIEGLNRDYYVPSARALLIAVAEYIGARSA